MNNSSSVAGVVLVSVLLACPALGQLPTSTIIPEPAPTNTERVHPALCGDGTWVPASEQCDDGNRFGGDGCGADCTREVLVTESFGPVSVPVLEPITTTILLKPTITYALSSLGNIAVRSFDVAPTGVAGVSGCFRGVEWPEEFGPGNIGGHPPRGLNASLSVNLLVVSVLLKSWYSEGDHGEDGRPCTDDDPGFANAVTAPRTFVLSRPPQSEVHCCGDCNSNDVVTVDEIVTVVNAALYDCPMVLRYQLSQSSTFGLVSSPGTPAETQPLSGTLTLVRTRPQPFNTYFAYTVVDFAFQTPSGLTIGPASTGFKCSGFDLDAGPGCIERSTFESELTTMTLSAFVADDEAFFRGGTGAVSDPPVFEGLEICSGALCEAIHGGFSAGYVLTIFAAQR